MSQHSVSFCSVKWFMKHYPGIEVLSVTGFLGQKFDLQCTGVRAHVRGLHALSFDRMIKRVNIYYFINLLTMEHHKQWCKLSETALTGEQKKHEEEGGLMRKEREECAPSIGRKSLSTFWRHGCLSNFKRFVLSVSYSAPQTAGHMLLWWWNAEDIYTTDRCTRVSVWSGMLECVDAITKFTVSDKGCHHRHGNTCAAERERGCNSVRERESRRQIRLFPCQLFPPPATRQYRNEGGKQYK